MWQAFWDTAKSIGNAIKEGLDSVISHAGEWGADMVKNFVSGILGNINLVSGASNKLASVAQSYLGHSHPTKGAMADDYKWMPDMMKLFATGIESNIPMVESAVSNVSSTMQGEMDYSPQLGAINTSIQGLSLAEGNTNVYVQISDGQLQKAVAQVMKGGALRSGGR
jgi:hypothetical protein